MLFGGEQKGIGMLRICEHVVWQPAGMVKSEVDCVDYEIGLAVVAGGRENLRPGPMAGIVINLKESF